MKRTVDEVARFIDAKLIGDDSVELSGIASVARASLGDLVFVEAEKHLQPALQSRASAVIAGDFGLRASTDKPLLISPHPRLAFARAAKLVCPNRDHAPGVHSAAVVHPKAVLADNVTIDARAVIGDAAEIGAGSWIGAGTVISSNVIIGNDCEVYPNVTIYSDAEIGDRVTIHSGAVLGSDGFGYVPDASTGRYEKFPQVGRLVIEDDVEIGANTTIDRGALETTRIRRGTKIDNLVHIAHNCDVGEDVVIAAQTGIAGSSNIENHVVLGGQVGIADHVCIEEGVIVGAQAGIPSNKILRGKGITFWGTPARPIRAYLRELAMLARLARKE